MKFVTIYFFYVKVIKSRNSDNAELELYPLNLGIMFIQNAVGSDLLNANWNIIAGTIHLIYSLIFSKCNNNI